MYSEVASWPRFMVNSHLEATMGEHLPAIDRFPAVSLRAAASLLGEGGIEARVCGDEGTEVHGMAIDSREVSPGNLFVCKGAAFRPAFLADAVRHGAAAYLCEDDERAEELSAQAPGVPCIVVHQGKVRRAMALVAPLIYAHPEHDLTIVGITGTKGKSTVVYMLRSILHAAGVTPSILGSIETDDGVCAFESHNTTPEAPDLWLHLRNTVDAGRDVMFMEVSSQGLKYGRVLGVPFKIACFLNIGRDHISPIEHPTFEDYFQSKLRIFEQCENAVVNLDTERAEEVLAAAASAKQLVTLHTEHVPAASTEDPAASARGRAADFCATDIETVDGGIAFTVEERCAAGTTRHGIVLGMMGFFNVDNALAACAIARLMGFDYDAIARGLAHVRVPGRMELVGSGDGHVLAIVDYAHNELSFDALFSSVKRQYPDRRIIAVFGAPGDKAQERRSTLPRVAGAYADLLIYTEEDPAHEAVEDICAELAANTPAGVAYEIIPDREEAVVYALHTALADKRPSVVLLLAKGDETRQHRGDSYPEVKSDLSLAREILRG